MHNDMEMKCFAAQKLLSSADDADIAIDSVKVQMNLHEACSTKQTLKLVKYLPLAGQTI